MVDNSDYPFKERRDQPRFQRKAKVLVESISNGACFCAALVNISREGILTYTERDLPPDAPVWIQIEISASQKVNATGRLYQSRPDGAVFSFTHIPRRSRTVLDNWLGGAASHIRW